MLNSPASTAPEPVVARLRFTRAPRYR